MPIRILIADDHPSVRQGLRLILSREGFAVVAECADGRDAVRQTETLRPDVAVLDLAMPLMSGLDATREILRVAPATRVVVLTRHEEEPYILEAMKAGVHGYVLKSQPASELVQAVRDVHRGRVYLHAAASSVVIDAYRAGHTTNGDPLSPRETKVLRLVAEGRTSKRIGEALGITEKTAESYRARIMAKLNIHDTAGLVRYAVRRGLVEP
jgi:DNA-binding NarL/FixJ family response regulator